MNKIKIAIIVLAAAVSGCSSQTSNFTPLLGFTEAANSGLVFECGVDDYANDFAYSINEESGLMEYWSSEAIGNLVRRQAPFVKSVGSLSNTTLNSPNAFPVTYYWASEQESLAPAGLLQTWDSITIINGSYNVAGDYDFEARGWRQYRCAPVEHSVASVDGILLVNSNSP